jgi:hypothetical protein
MNHYSDIPSRGQKQSGLILACPLESTPIYYSKKLVLLRNASLS